MIPVDAVHKECSNQCDDGHPVIIGSVPIDLPAVPAEREEEFDASLGMD